MNLSQYLDKRVVIETDNHKIFRGKVIDFLPEEENPEPSIILRCAADERLVELTRKDIRTIDRLD